MKLISFLLFSFLFLQVSQSKLMKVKQGEVFKVVLKANHSTGYSWHWSSNSNESIVDSVYVDYILSDKAIVGGGGHEIWEFKAKKKGSQKLIMTYKRPWEKEENLEIREILIEVD